MRPGPVAPGFSRASARLQPGRRGEAKASHYRYQFLPLPISCLEVNRRSWGTAGKRRSGPNQAEAWTPPQNSGGRPGDSRGFSDVGARQSTTSSGPSGLDAAPLASLATAEMSAGGSIGFDR
jgi:hypothetical protein